jgi:hypothetical protein
VQAGVLYESPFVFFSCVFIITVTDPRAGHGAIVYQS